MSTLAHDIIQVADALKLDRIILVGHSIAGDEMTACAVAAPDRLSSLVYWDGAYDRTKAPKDQAPEQPISDDDVASVERLEARFARVFGWRLPEAEVRAQVVVGSDGEVLRSTASPEVAAAILKGVTRPEYKKVRVPALAIYASTDIRSAYPALDTFDADNRSRADRQVAGLKSWQETSIRQFRQDAPNGRAVRLGSGNHYIFLTNEAEVVYLTLGFLTTTASR